MNFVSNRSGHVATATAPRHCHLLLRKLSFRWRHLLAIQLRGATRRSSCGVDADANASDATPADADGFLSAAPSNGVSARTDALASAASHGAGAFSSNDDEHSTADASAASGSPVNPAATEASLTKQAEPRRARESYASSHRLVNVSRCCCQRHAQERFQRKDTPEMCLEDGILQADVAQSAFY